MASHIFTSITANYIPKARVLARSVKQYHPSAIFHLLLADDIPVDFTLDNEPFDTILKLEELDIPNLFSWIFKHSIVEACTAIKPFALIYLLKKVGAEKVYYFDPDIAIFSRLDSLDKELETHSVILTPHLSIPEKNIDAVMDNELSASKHGLYNLGFVGVKNDTIGLGYAEWWAERCYHFCYDDIPNGIFTDQKWNDFAPIFFENVGILKNPEYNVCTWNYAQRHIEGNMENGFTVDGAPLCFHHFSGVDSGDQAIMRDKYGKDMPATLRLSAWYQRACAEDAQEAMSQIRWRYSVYDNDELIKQSHRLMYRQRQDLQEAFPNPFSTHSQSEEKLCYQDWLKNQQLWDRELLPNGSQYENFSTFINLTQQNTTGYILRTKHLRNWQKKIILFLILTSFKVVKSLVYFKTKY